MRVLLIALQNTTPGPATPDEQTRWAELGSPMRTGRMEEEHALALARSMRDGGNFAPMLVCLEHSSLHSRAVQLNLPVIPVSSANLRNPLNLWKLWRWQRRHARLLVQTVGQDAMGLARGVLRMREPGATLLAHAFLLRPPTAQSMTGKPFLAAHKILCGSQHILERMPAHIIPEAAAGKGASSPDNKAHADADNAAPLAECGEKGRTLRLGGDLLTLIAPGMSLDDFAPSSPWGLAQASEPLAGETAHPCDQRFIFALADAMTPRSGAQLVTRAMAAIWQRNDLPTWEVRALGGGPRYAELLEEAENLGVSSRLCLLNEQSLPEVLRHCHAWMAPGSSPEELPESLWAGVAAFLPTVCSKSSLHRERLSLNGNDPADLALLVEENDTQALAKA
jgi:glycosyltransferase involved in cell wall biosynthesis